MYSILKELTCVKYSKPPAVPDWLSENNCTFSSSCAIFLMCKILWKPKKYLRMIFAYCKNVHLNVFLFTKETYSVYSLEFYPLDILIKTRAERKNQNWEILHHHHHIALVARISLTLSRHSSLSFIALGRSSGQHPVSSHSCWMYVRAGRPAFARPCVGVHKSTSLMSSSLLLQQCPACLARLTWIVFVIGGRWPYKWCLVRCCRQDLFKIARSILV